MKQRDQQTDELLSAYVDGELSADEQARVEQWLGEHREHQRMLDELRALTQGMQALPRFRLDDRFHERVLCLAEERRDQATDVASDHQHDGDVGPAVTLPTRAESGGWRAWSFALVTVAVAVLLVVFGRLGLLSNPAGRTGPEIGARVEPESQDPKTPNVEPLEWTAQSEAEAALVRVGDGSGDVELLPPTEQMVGVAGQLRLVIEVTLTEAGEEQQVLDQVFNRHGIWRDKDLKVERQLEQALLESRFINKPAKVGARQGELLYVTGRGHQIDSTLVELRTRKEAFAKVLLDFAVEPADVQTIHQLRLADRKDLMRRERDALARISRVRRVLLEFAAMTRVGQGLSIGALTLESPSPAASASASAGTSATGKPQAPSTEKKIHPA